MTRLTISYEKSPGGVNARNTGLVYNPLMNISKDQRGFSPYFFIIILLILAALGFAAWRVFKTEPATESADTSQSQSTAEETEAAPQLLTYQSPAEGLKFDYPATWTKADKAVTAPDDVAADYDAITLTSPSGATVLWDSYLDGIGSACDVETDGEVVVSAFEESENISGVFYVEAKLGSKLTHIGLIDKINDEKPKVGGTGNCILFTVFPGKQSPTSVWLRAGKFDPANAEDLAAIKAIMLSARY